MTVQLGDVNQRLLKRSQKGKKDVAQVLIIKNLKQHFFGFTKLWLMRGSNVCVCVSLEKHLKQTNKDGSLIYMFLLYNTANFAQNYQKK